MTPEQTALVNDHLRIPKAVARRLSRGSTLDHDEIEAIANLALVRAVGSYDPKRGVDFGSYAYGQCVYATLDVAKAERRRKKGRVDVSLSHKPFEGSAATVEDYLAEPTEPTPDEMALTADVRSKLKRALPRLSYREEQVIEMYFFENFTQEEIGEVFGVTPSMISIIRKRALIKLGHAVGVAA